MNNGSRYLILILVLFGASSCSKIDKVDSECSIRVSEKVYNGQFDVNDVEYIGIINGVSQKSLYPLPDWKGSSSILVIKDVKFFKDFKTSLIAAGWKQNPTVVNNIVGNVQILVSFKSGPGAYLHCYSTGHSLKVSPMFEDDSYGNENEALFALINRELGISKATAN